MNGPEHKGWVSQAKGRCAVIHINKSLTDRAIVQQVSGKRAGEITYGSQEFISVNAAKRFVERLSK